MLARYRFSNRQLMKRTPKSATSPIERQLRVLEAQSDSLSNLEKVDLDLFHIAVVNLLADLRRVADSGKTAPYLSLEHRMLQLLAMVGAELVSRGKTT
jgi:hypothetical protein